MTDFLRKRPRQGRAGARVWVLVTGHNFERLLKRAAGGPGFFEDIALHPDTAGRLNEAAGNNEFDRLVIIAPARRLALLRRGLSAAVQLRVAAEIRRDLTRLPDGDLQQALEKIVWF